MTTDTSLRSSFFRERGLDGPLFHLWADVRWRSKGEILATSRCFPLYPRKQTSGVRAGMSVRCQVRKWSVLTIRLIDFKHDYSPPDFYPGTTASPDRVVIPVNERPYGIYDGFNSK